MFQNISPHQINFLNTQRDFRIYKKHYRVSLKYRNMFQNLSENLQNIRQIFQKYFRIL